MMNNNHLNSEENCLSVKSSEYFIDLSNENCGDRFNHLESYDNNNNACLIAGLRIFSFVLLQSWRRSKREILRLKLSLDDLKISCTRTESQLRVHSSLIKLEQHRTDELTTQLKRTLDNLQRKTECCKSFLMTLSDLKASQGLLKEELKNRCEEYDALNEVLSQTKKQLFHSMQKQRNLNLQLCKEQRKVQCLGNVKKLLISEIRDLSTEHHNEEENFLKRLRDKDCEIVEAKKLLEQYESRCFQKNLILHDSNLQLSRYNSTELQKNSIFQRLGMFWTRFIEYPKYTLNCVYILSYYLLPATPSKPVRYDEYN